MAKVIFWNSFQLPITYLENQYPLSQIVASDLELVYTAASTPQTTGIHTPTLYEHLLLTETSSPFAKQMTAHWAERFTTDTDFLKQTQQIIQNLPPDLPSEEETPTATIQKTWEEITLVEDFKEKFNYIEFQYLEPFNRNASFLQCLNLIHLSSPVMTFLVFLFFILFPILLVFMSKTALSLDTYIFHMASLAKVSFMGKLAKSAIFNGWAHYQTLGMVVGCILFYGVQFYNSYVSYFRFWRNVELVNQHLLHVREFVQSSIPKLRAFLHTCQTTAASTYRRFAEITQGHLQNLESIQHWLRHVKPYSYSIGKCYDFGDMFQCYYELHTNREFDASIRYTAGFQGFWENIQVLRQRLCDQSIACAVFPSLEEIAALDVLSVPVDAASEEADSDSDETEDAQTNADNDAEQEQEDTEEEEEESTHSRSDTPDVKKKKIDNQLYGMYYPAHDDKEAVRNDCDLAENWIITGPNASGKTTYLKTVALNLIFTQQLGMGCYRHCVLYRPYTQFHTYLNIPDTSDRDSLFQAEVRRGKEILDSVSASASSMKRKQEEEDEEEVIPGTVCSPQTNTFLLMDELFSGTNHEDAVQAAYGFLCYLGHPMRQVNTRFLLTTHFVDICDKIESTAPHVARNGKMLIDETELVDENTCVEDAENTEGEIRYLYQFKEGISRLKCGMQILKQMKYPTEVMHYAKTRQ
jgi:hypothetical protein